jgi:hypothetical protein
MWSLIISCYFAIVIILVFITAGLWREGLEILLTASKLILQPACYHFDVLAVSSPCLAITPPPHFLFFVDIFVFLDEMYHTCIQCCVSERNCWFRLRSVYS